ncbi:MAG: carboxylating nicotinate-nucleotide diphosphorylase [Bacteroidia bacterium]|nr:carboxylating nicotinate-nucleotide diphosphorylase [Bacteroidia bacterium]
MPPIFQPPLKFHWKGYVRELLKEDLNDGVDVTSDALIPKSHQSQMILKIKEDGVLAGVSAAEIIFKTALGKKVKFKRWIKDGELVKPGDVAFEISGPTQQLLVLERPVLNIMQRMSGIATHARRLQSLCNGTNARITDTRKTTPLFRYFEKWAVCIGGGTNHRYGLFDMMLVKDNHIDANGGLDAVFVKIEKYFQKHKKIPVIVEARSLDDVRKILNFKLAGRILLDNFTLEMTKEAVKMAGRKKKLESSGGIHEGNIRDYALCGVDFISIGALTHHVKSLDLSLKLLI